MQGRKEKRSPQVGRLPDRLEASGRAAVSVCCKECELGASLPTCVSTLGAEWGHSEPLSTVNRADPHLTVMSG